MGCWISVLGLSTSCSETFWQSSGISSHYFRFEQHLDSEQFLASYQAFSAKGLASILLDNLWNISCNNRPQISPSPWGRWLDFNENVWRLYFCCTICIFYTRANKGREQQNGLFSCFFGATFEKIWLKKASFDLFEQLFEKSQATCGKHQNITIANQSINNSRLSFLEEGKGGGC